MTISDNRKRLIQEFGPEVVIKCCREWKTHLGNGRFGVCGICHQKPQLVMGKKWDN